MNFPSIEDQLNAIKRGTVEVLPEDELVKKLKKAEAKNKPLNIKMGFDPTAPDIHLGHTVGIRKLRQFQDLGHKVTVIIGDYTATVGDPTDKKVTRPRLTHEDVMKNADTYKNQILKILNPEQTEFRFNGEWFSKMSFNDVMSLGASCTVAQMLERNDFSNRYKSQQPISLHEFFYPLMQGYDSVEIDADLEMGATEQKFNLVMGRQLQEHHGKEKQCILTMPVLEGIDGVQRMSKSIGNYIGIDESPREIFGKTMKIPDELIYRYFELVTDVTLDELPKIKEFTESDPRNAKRSLARKIVDMYHAEGSGKAAEEEFDRIFIKKDVPDDVAEHKVTAGSIRMIDFIHEVGFAKSKGEARRLIKGGGVTYNKEKFTEEEGDVTFVNDAILKVGKKKFLKTII